MRPDLSPVGRALRVLELLQEQPGIAAAALAGKLGVTERATRRYVAMLREVGIPVESTRGPYGGYRLGRGVRLPPLMFSTAEALALVMAGLERNATDANDPGGSALAKIIRALPESVARQAATVYRHAAAAPDPGMPRPRPEITSALVAAATDRRRVGIEYHSQSGARWGEDVDPWAVVVRRGLWYLLCHSHRAGEVRTYRVDRIEAVTARDERFAAPEQADAIQLLEQHLGLGWEHETRVVFDAPMERVAHYVRPPMGRLEPLDAAHCLLLGSTSNPAMYAGEWLAAIPIAFRVEGGPELRAAVAAVAERMRAAVQDRAHDE